MEANSHQIVNLDPEERLAVLAELLLEIVLEELDEGD